MNSNHLKTVRRTKFYPAAPTSILVLAPFSPARIKMCHRRRLAVQGVVFWFPSPLGKSVTAGDPTSGPENRYDRKPAILGSCITSASDPSCCNRQRGQADKSSQPESRLSNLSVSCQTPKGFAANSHFLTIPSAPPAGKSRLERTLTMKFPQFRVNRRFILYCNNLCQQP